MVKTLADGTKIIEALGKCMRVKYRVCSHNKCLPPDARIATPLGDISIALLSAGMPVWTRDEHDNRVAGVIVRTARTPVERAHRVARVVLANGRTVVASPEHPLVDGTRVGELSIGDRYDGSTVRSLELVPYAEPYTYDILPAGTGVYWANDVALRSTLE